MSQTVEVVLTEGGAKVYRIPLEAFPGLWGYAHLILADGMRALVDVGSGFGDSNDHLEAGLEAVRREHGEDVGWGNLTQILITHGHIDHFGGLGYVRARTDAPIGVHELDLRVLVNYEDRLTVVARRLREFLRESGAGKDREQRLMELYLLNKHLFSSVPVQFTFEAAGMQVGPLRLRHVPGHCPGHVVFLLDDVMLAGDHILRDISPNIAPENLTLNTGLGHYLHSLDRVRRLAPSVRKTLGGHGGVVDDLAARVDQIKEIHRRRLLRVLDVLQDPRTTFDVADALFPTASGYHELLAIQEAGAHVEYLAQRGFLRVDNLDEVANNSRSPIRYRRVDAERLPAGHLEGGLFHRTDPGEGRGRGADV